MKKPLGLLLFGVLRLGWAESDLDFAKAVQNPLRISPAARYYSLPFENYSNFQYGPSRDLQNVLYMKPITPFYLSGNYDFVPRTIIPVTSQPTGNGSTINGLGDINPTLFVIPAFYQPLLWAVGPTFVLPTATNGALGAGKWSVGPEFSLITAPGNWSLAFLTSNVWSVAGEKNKPTVNQFSFQYFVSYNFSHGWFVTSQPVILANWQQPQSQIWTVPAGGGVGRAFRIGKQGLHLSLEGYYNVIKPDASEQWTAKAVLEFLFLDKRTDRGQPIPAGPPLAPPIP